MDRDELRDLKAGCLLPIDGFEIEIKPNARILILGAGGGEDMLRFIRNGYECVGVEADRDYARKTKTMLEEMGEDSAILLHSERLQLPSEIGEFSLILFSNVYFSKIIGSRKRVEILKTLHKHLEPTGKIYFEFETRDSQGSGTRYPIALIRFIRFFLRRNRPIIEHGVELTNDLPQLVHYFVRQEITQELKSASLAIDELFIGTAGSVLCRRSCPLTKEPATTLDRRVLQAVS